MDKEKAKAKAYDRALEIAKAWCKLDNNDLSNDDLKTLFPELRESEDERVKSCISMILTDANETRFNDFHTTLADCLAWLKKQNPIQNINKEDEEVRQYIIRTMRQKDINVPMVQKALAWLEKQGKSFNVFTRLKESKDLDDFTREYSFNIPSDIYNCLPKEKKSVWINEIENAIKAGAQWFEKQAEQKPTIEMKSAEESLGIDSETYNKIVDECIYGDDKRKPAGWCEEDENKINTIIQIYHPSKKIMDWLKSLKDRVQPQNIAYYNPYKEVVESIAEMCKHYDKASHSGLRDFYDNVKVKCKDAKEYESLFPQNTWKPSMAQLNALSIVSKGNAPDDIDAIQSLYNDLKKLREE